MEQKQYSDIDKTWRVFSAVESAAHMISLNKIEDVKQHFADNKIKHIMENDFLRIRMAFGAVNAIIDAAEKARTFDDIANIKRMASALSDKTDIYADIVRQNHAASQSVLRG